MPKDNLDRRGFLASAAATAAVAAAPSAARAATDSNSRMRLGFIGVGGRAQRHIDSACELFKDDNSVEIATVCDVFNRYRDETAEKVQRNTGLTPTKTGDYRDILNDDSIDAVVISTPDHWHAKQTIDSLTAGKDVYCEKPMTHSVDEALAVHQAWKDSGKVMQVGVQSTSLPVWNAINERIRNGGLGKLLTYQTEYFRNSDLGQWRYYKLTADMTPKNVDWKMFLGTDFGLAPDQPFDRARFAQWRCYWDFGAGMFTDLFVHRTTSMLKATGLRFPGRVTGAGGIYLEYDGRDVPDVATVVADFKEGVQGLVTATMCCEDTPLKQMVRGHHGTVLPSGGQKGPGIGEDFSGYEFIAERSPVTHDSSIKTEHVDVGGIANTSLAHFKNFVDSAKAGKPENVNCSPELGAAAMTIVKLGSLSYREGKVYRFDDQSMSYSEADGSWARGWEKMSHDGASPNHVPGWTAGDKGSKLFPRGYQKLAGPWVDGKDPAQA